MATRSETVERWRGRRVEARVAGEEVGMRNTEEVESARDGRVCAWRSGPRAQVSGEPRGDIPEVCGATRAGAWGEVCMRIRGCGRCGEGGSSQRGGGASRRLGLSHAHDTSTCALSALTTCVTCAFRIDSGSDALPVTGLRTRRGRVVHCRGWRSQQGIGTARSPAPLRQGVEVGGAAPGAGAGGWCEKTTKKPW